MTASVSPSSYVAISRRTLDLEDYIDIARRHASWIAGPVLAGIVISTVVAFALPNVYLSQAEIEITPATISESIVKSTTVNQLTERIIQMQQEILSRTSLSTIIQDPHLDLYKTDRARLPIEDVIEKMRVDDIKIKIDSLAGEGNRRASAFSISFFYPDRVKARDTVQALITRLTEINLTTQRTMQTGTNSYVHDELTTAKATLDQLTEQLTKFRIENSGKLPEQSQLNIAQLTSLQQQASTINDGLNRLAQEKVQLDTHLQTLQGQMELVSMFDREAQPLTAPLARQQNDQLLQLNRTIEGSEANLEQLKKIYKANYPDIRDAEARLQVMESQRDTLQKKQDEELAKETAKEEEAAKSQQPGKKPTNFTAAQSLSAVQGQIDTNKALIKNNEMQRAILLRDQQTNAKQIDAYQAKLAATSGIEATYAEMIANQKAAGEKYQTLQRSQDLTEQNGELLQRKLTENLEVIDPPSLPMAPTKPNRWEIVGGGAAIGFILGLALAGVQEAKDTSLKNLKDVRAYTNLPVLSSIPLLENTLLVRRKRRIAYLGWSAAVIVGLLAISVSLYYYSTTLHT
jgi:succinoglycan biosynthesis transport protein ExoP